MRFDDPAVDRLDRYLDAVANGEPLTGVEHDSALRATDARLRALDGPPTPDRSFVERLRADLLRTEAIPTAPAAPFRSLRPSRIRPMGIRARMATPPVAPTGRWQPLSGWAAFTALLVVTLVVGTFAFAALRPETGDGPSVGGPDAPGVMDELLVRAKVSTLPTGSHTWMGFERIMIAPGATVQFGPARHAGDGPLLFVVEAGSITFRADGPAVLLRSGTAADSSMPVDPEAEVLLTTGDRGFAPSGVTAQWRNTGSIAATIMDASLSSSGSGRRPPGSAHQTLFNRQNATWPELPTVLSLHRVSLAPGASMPVDALPPVAMLYVDAGELEVPLWAEATTPARTRVFAAGDGMSAADWTIAADGQFRNTGTETAAVLVLTNEPVDTPGVTHDVIAQVDIADMRTDYPTTYLGIGRFTLDPGESLASGPESTYGDALYLFLVESGSIALTANGRAELSTGNDGVSTPAAVGSEVVLDAGDRGVVWPGTVAVWRNLGPGRATVLNAAVGEAVIVPDEFELMDLVKTTSPTDWPALPATFALHRLTFEPDARLPVADLPGLLVLGVDAGSLDVPLVTAAGTPVPSRDFDAGDGFVMQDWPVALDGEFRNSGSEPAVVFVLTAQPFDAPGGTATP